MLDEVNIKNALEVINNALLEINDNNPCREDFYYWAAVLESFDYQIDKCGNIVKSGNSEN